MKKKISDITITSKEFEENPDKFMDLVKEKKFIFINEEFEIDGEETGIVLIDFDTYLDMIELTNPDEFEKLKKLRKEKDPN